MWSFLIFVWAISTWAEAQNSRRPEHDPHGHGWDIRLAVPGEPGNDYPTLGNIPRTSFTCAGKEPGYYADVETNCQVFRVCTAGSTYGFQSFLCPNGTLFNQAVFVCDWWMNVNCQNSQQLFNRNNNNDQFGNLRLGPQLMKDIKKMLTHPMRNPYDRDAMKGNLIVMQDYKPPSGQLFPNGALLAGPERAPNNIFVPAKQIQQNVFDTNDIAFGASTPNPQYIPATFNSYQSTSQRDAETFQRQRQNGQYVQRSQFQNTQNLPSGNFVSNGHTGRQSLNKVSYNSNNNGNSQFIRPTETYNVQYGQRQFSNTGTTQSFNAKNALNQNGQFNRVTTQYTNNNQLSQLNNGKQSDFGVSYTKQYDYNSNQENQPYTYKPPLLQFSDKIKGQVGNEAKQNLVSNNPAAVRKTIKFSRIVQESKPGSPKSRITFKTWIVKPKGAKLIAEPTPYTYDRPTNPPTEIISQTTPYAYENPTTSTLPSRIVSEPYVYNKPTIASKQISVSEPEPYVYSRPTVAAKQIITEEPSTPYLNPISSTAFPGRYQTPTSATPTIASRLYLAPTTFKPSVRYYLPPSPTPLLSRQYLTPNSIQATEYFQSAKLKAIPTTPNSIRATEYFQTPKLKAAPTTPNSLKATEYFQSTKIKPAPTTSNTIQTTEYFQSAKFTAAPTAPSAFALPSTTTISNKNSLLGTKPSYVNNNKSQNLIFTDILTKQKLDLTVNDIVTDTRKILKTASPERFGQLRQDIKSQDYVEDNYLPPKSITESGENLTPQSPTVALKSAKLVATVPPPSIDLEPPPENYINQNVNQLSNLPYFKESVLPTKTIERTVSLKISIPEKVASYIFKSSSESNFDRLEILNTGSSNYLILSNNNLSDKNNVGSFIPIGKLIADKNSNISDSQALVYSLLADSINVAKGYSNLAQQDAVSATPTPTQPQFQFVNNEELEQITNKISQLTSSQFGANNNANKANLVSTAQTTTTSQSNGYRENNKFINTVTQNQRTQSNIVPSQQTARDQFSSRLQIPSNQQINPDSDQIYSGQLYQLPVPDVTTQIYNRQSSANLVQADNRQQTPKPLQQNIQPNALAQNLGKQLNSKVEIVQSQTLPLTAAKIQLTPPSETETFSRQENIDNFLTGNGISAHLQDKIVGTIPHPLEDNKLVTYKKDESYYVYTKLDNNALIQNLRNDGGVIAPSRSNQQSAKIIQGDTLPNIVAFQLIPSVSYQIEDNNQQKILNTFQLSSFVPKEQKSNQVERQDIVSNVDYSIEHPSAKQLDAQYNDVNALYTGPSSYSAPQSSVGSLRSNQGFLQNNFNSRIENLDENSNGYPKEAPARRFVF